MDRPPRADPATRDFLDGITLLDRHPLMAPLLDAAQVIRRRDGAWSYGAALCMVSNAGYVYCHPKNRASPEVWAYAIAHALLHLGLGHFQVKANPALWNAACDLYITRLLHDFGFRHKEDHTTDTAIVPLSGEVEIYEWMLVNGCPDAVWNMGTGGSQPDMIFKETEMRKPRPDWAACFQQGLRAAVQRAVDVAGGRITRLDAQQTESRAAEEARRWFIDHFPLLGAVAAAFKLIEDPVVCRTLDVSIAAVSDRAREIYINPAAGLTAQELRFVMAHEMLHAALRHTVRRRGRDPYLWNVACDYIINDWLIEMAVGAMPASALYDPQLKGLSAESVYDRLCTDLRRARKLATLRGAGRGDMLDDNVAGGPSSGSPAWTDLDAFYRRALMDGLDLHRATGRGLLPAGLVEEIRALAQPPIDWDVELGRWFDERFTPLEPVRSYARPSRRQAATPDIPRPRWLASAGLAETRTFGVVLDSSGSMDRLLLGKALGAIASYAMTKDVAQVRVVFCDAAAYDQGYMEATQIASSLAVRGRGGTMLQPGIDLLEREEDFPADAPILIITDGACDALTIHREHALLIPAGARLPFVPRGAVFRMG